MSRAPIIGVKACAHLYPKLARVARKVISSGAAPISMLVRPTAIWRPAAHFGWLGSLELARKKYERRASTSEQENIALTSEGFLLISIMVAIVIHDFQ